MASRRSGLRVCTSSAGASYEGYKRAVEGEVVALTKPWRRPFLWMSESELFSRLFERRFSDMTVVVVECRRCTLDGGWRKGGSSKSLEDIRMLYFGLFLLLLIFSETYPTGPRV